MLKTNLRMPKIDMGGGGAHENPYMKGCRTCIPPQPCVIWEWTNFRMEEREKSQPLYVGEKC